MKIGPLSFERHNCSYPYQSLQQSENKWCAETLVLSGEGEAQVSSKWANGGSALRPFTRNMSCLVLLSTLYSLQSNQTIFTSTNTFFPINPLLWVDIIMIEIKKKYWKILKSKNII